jgi:hypothetical protein
MVSLAEHLLRIALSIFWCINMLNCAFYIYLGKTQ